MLHHRTDDPLVRAFHIAERMDAEHVEEEWRLGRGPRWWEKIPEFHRQAVTEMAPTETKEVADGR